MGDCEAKPRTKTKHCITNDWMKFNQVHRRNESISIQMIINSSSNLIDSDLIHSTIKSKPRPFVLSTVVHYRWASGMVVEFSSVQIDCYDCSAHNTKKFEHVVEYRDCLQICKRDSIKCNNSMESPETNENSVLQSGRATVANCCKSIRMKIVKHN